MKTFTGIGKKPALIALAIQDNTNISKLKIL